MNFIIWLVVAAIIYNLITGNGQKNAGILILGMMAIVLLVVGSLVVSIAHFLFPVAIVVGLIYVGTRYLGGGGKGGGYFPK
ncbi:MAG: hypothetical protein ACYC1M_10900 [Armatimonadota bacterium]